jgi:endonuclease/exonuclease/phosphatase family metal-dependent hydrolase
MIMRICLYAAILFGLLGSIACGGRGPKADSANREIRVMTYNIRVGIGLDGKWSGTDSRENLQQIGSLIREEKADIVFLQEVDYMRKRSGGLDQPTLLGEFSGLTPVYGPAIFTEGPDGVSIVDGYGIALLSRWPVREYRVERLYKPDYSKSHPEYPDYYGEQRVAIVARIAAPGGDITVIDTHLGLTPDQREKQLARIAEIATAEARKRPVIVAGDFNALPRAAEMAPVRVVLKDVYAILPSPPLTFPADKADRTIDFIFHDDRLEAREVRVIQTTLSDHLPVLAVLERKD